MSEIPKYIYPIVVSIVLTVICIFLLFTEIYTEPVEYVIQITVLITGLLLQQKVPQVHGKNAIINDVIITILYAIMTGWIHGILRPSSEIISIKQAIKFHIFHDGILVSIGLLVILIKYVVGRN